MVSLEVQALVLTGLLELMDYLVQLVLRAKEAPKDILVSKVLWVQPEDLDELGRLKKMGFQEYQLTTNLYLHLIIMIVAKKWDHLAKNALLVPRERLVYPASKEKEAIEEFVVKQVKPDKSEHQVLPVQLDPQELMARLVYQANLENQVRKEKQVCAVLKVFLERLVKPVL